MKVASPALNSTYNKERLYKVILGPHISEKVSILGDAKNQYAFKVLRDATKAEVKKAVEELFLVTVVDVCVLNVKGKVKRTAPNTGSPRRMRGSKRSGGGGRGAFLRCGRAESNLLRVRRALRVLWACFAKHFSASNFYIIKLAACNTLSKQPKSAKQSKRRNSAILQCYAILMQAQLMRDSDLQA